MFRSYKRKLSFRPEDGYQVIATAQVGLYEARGDYQLIVEDMEEAGDGALLRAFEILKNKLSAEGLFDPAGKKPLPQLPGTIGVITSPTGAAIRDIISVLKRRFPSIPVILYPVAVQGEEAKHEIIDAIYKANNRMECDVLILARGGGSLEDLWSFNEESVARAIFSSTLPIITGIGHETDFTIADFTADLRAPTPSAAAEHITPDASDWQLKFQSLQQRFERLIRARLLDRVNQLTWLNKRLQQKEPGKQLQAKAQRLDELEFRLQHSLQTRLQHSKADVEIRTARLWQFNPSAKIKHFDQYYQTMAERLTTAIKHQLTMHNQQLAITSQTLHAVSPLATLNRGYAIITHPTDDQVITSSAELKQGDLIKTRLASGRFISQIEAIEND